MVVGGLKFGPKLTLTTDQTILPSLLMDNLLLSELISDLTLLEKDTRG